MEMSNTFQSKRRRGGVQIARADSNMCICVGLFVCHSSQLYIIFLKHNSESDRPDRLTQRQVHSEAQIYWIVPPRHPQQFLKPLTTAFDD